MKRKVLKPNVVRGGIAIPLGANYYYMSGRKHKDGGIDVGNNPRTGLEVEDGEVMHINKNEAKVFSAVPFLNGKSPAQKVISGENPNDVFKQQEKFKDINNINDDGTKKESERRKAYFGSSIFGWGSSSYKAPTHKEIIEADKKRAVIYKQKQREKEREKERRDKIIKETNNFRVHKENNEYYVGRNKIISSKEYQENIRKANPLFRHLANLNYVEYNRRLHGKIDKFENNNKNINTKPNTSKANTTKTNNNKINTNINKTNINKPDNKVNTNNSINRQTNDTNKINNRTKTNIDTNVNNKVNTNNTNKNINTKPNTNKTDNTNNKIKSANSFANAFRSARKEGKDIFEWNGKKYTTKLAGETKKANTDKSNNTTNTITPNSNLPFGNDIIQNYINPIQLEKENEDIRKDPFMIKMRAGGTKKKAQYGILDKIDEYAEKSEPYISGASLALTGTSLVAPNPYTAIGAYITNLVGGSIDTYQAIRHFSKGDYKQGLQNTGEAVLSLIGGKIIKHLAKTKSAKQIGAVREKMIDEAYRKRTNNKIKLMRKGLTDEQAASVVLTNAKNAVDNSIKFRDVKKGIEENNKNKTNKIIMAADAIADGNDIRQEINNKKMGGVNRLKDYSSNFKIGSIYSVTSNGKTNLRMLPSTGERTKAYVGAKKKFTEKDKLADIKRINKYVNDMDLNGPKSYKAIAKQVYGDKYKPYKVDPKNIKLDPGIPAFNNDGTFNAFALETAKRNGNRLIYNKYNKDNDDKQRNINDIVSDSLGITSNIIGSSISHNVNRKMLNKLKYNKAPINFKATKLKTNININPQLDKMRESLASYERDIDNNTASSRVALARKQRGRINNMLQTNELYGEKENNETELINKDRINQQSIINKNIEEYNNWRNNKVAFENAVAEKKSENDVGLINSINSAVQDIIGRRELRGNERQTRLALMAANPNVSPRLLKAFGIKGITDEDIKNFDKAHRRKING